MASTGLSPKTSFLYAFDGGTDWKTIHVRDTSKKSDLTDTIKGIKFSNIAWLPDDGFSIRAPNEAGKYDDSQTVSIYFHAIVQRKVKTKRYLRLTSLHGTLILGCSRWQNTAHFCVRGYQANSVC